MGIPPELIDGERFVRAWKRFRVRFPEHFISDEHRDMLRQYVETARFYHDRALRAQGLDVGLALTNEFATIATEATGLIEAKCTSVAPSQYRIPRPSDYLKRKHQITAASAAAPGDDAEITPSHDDETEANPLDDANTQLMDLSYDELKAIMEPKKLSEDDHSAQEIRRRLGLVDRDRANQTSISSETIAREEQENIQADMVNLAKTLKARTQTINESLVDDVKILDAVGQSAESNAVLLDRENSVLKQQLASSIGFWTSLWLIMGAIMVFMATYIFMKLFSRRL